jgi:hypothetical protein
MGSWKLTANMGHQVQFLAHCKLAPDRFQEMNILEAWVFDLVDWKMVHKTLHNMLKLFQQWACKQVMGIARTMEWDKTLCRKCPNACKSATPCAHVLFCDHAGPVETPNHSINLLEDWLSDGLIYQSRTTELYS